MKRTLALVLTALVAVMPLAARADDDENKGHNDNGHHYGWSKQHANDDNDGNEGRHHKHRKHGQASTIYGRITGINGSLLSLQLNDGRVITVDDSRAVAAGHTNGISIGSYVRVDGYTGTNGVVVANSVGSTTASNPNNQNQATVFGRITGINGSMLTLALDDGRVVSVDDSRAVATGRTSGITVGSYVRVDGFVGNNGVIIANSIGTASAQNPNQQQGIYIPIPIPRL